MESKRKKKYIIDNSKTILRLFLHLSINKYFENHTNIY